MCLLTGDLSQTRKNYVFLSLVRKRMRLVDLLFILSIFFYFSTIHFEINKIFLSVSCVVCHSIFTLSVSYISEYKLNNIKKNCRINKYFFFFCNINYAFSHTHFIKKIICYFFFLFEIIFVQQQKIQFNTKKKEKKITLLTTAVKELPNLHYPPFRK